MKNLFMSAFIASMLISCGKQNAVNTQATINGLNSNITNSVSIDLASKINSNQMGSGMVYVNGYTETMYQLVMNYPNVNFYYGTYTVSQTTPDSNVNCTGGFIKFCASWSGISTSTLPAFTTTRSITYLSISDADKKSQLIGLINNSATVSQVSFNRYVIFGKDSKAYTIDTNMPLQANPVMTQNSDGTVETLYKWGTY